MGIDILIIFLARDLNSIVFKSENSVGLEKIPCYFAVRIYFIIFGGTKFAVEFSTGDDILANFSGRKVS